MFKAWTRDEAGQAMSEYGLLVALLVVGIVAVAITFRGKIAEVFNKATNQLGKPESSCQMVNGELKCTNN